MIKFFKYTKLIYKLLTSTLPKLRMIMRIIVLVARRLSTLISAAITSIIIDAASEYYPSNSFARQAFVKMILLLGLYFLLTVVISSVLEIIDKKQRETDVFLISKQLQEKIIDKVKYIDCSVYDISEKLNIMSRGQSFNEENLYKIYIAAILSFGNIISFIGYGIVLCVYNPVIFIAAVLVEGLKFINDIKSTTATDELKREITGLSRQRDYFLGVMKGGGEKELKAYNAYDFFWDKYKSARDKTYKLERKTDFSNSVRTVLMEIFAYIIDGLVYGIIVFSAVYGKITIGDIVFLFSAYSMMREGAAGSCYFVNDLYSVTRDIGYIEEFLNMENEIINDEALNKPAPVVSHSCTFEFRHVWFRYPETEEYVLEDINLFIKSPSKVALVGLNGAGKSTLVKLMLRIYDPTKGEVLLNGTNIKEYNPLEYYKLFSLLFQDYFTYAVSLRQNIGFYDEARNDDKRLDKALYGSQTFKFMDKMSNGIDTEISRSFSNEGYIPSTGENQRIALARAIYHERPIMILDEPSASIDAVAEHEILQYINKGNNALIKVIISHRLSNVSDCDIIVVLSGKRILEIGTHSELLEKKGLYSKLYTEQSSQYISAIEGKE